MRYLPQHDAGVFAHVVELTFQVGKTLADKINTDVFHGAMVILPGHVFTKTFSYGGNALISQIVDHGAVLAAVRKTFEGVEHADDVFTDAKTFGDVVAKIDLLHPSVDTRLSTFATEWRARVAAVPTTGWDSVNWHVLNTYLNPALPCFLYFDDYKLLDGKINLDGLNARKTNSTLTDADKTALGLFELAGIQLPDLMSEKGYENSKAKLEAIGLSITDQVFEYWTQNRELSVEFDVKADPTDQAPFNTGKNRYIRIKNIRHGVTVPFDQRSKGFIWFFSFMVWFSAVENRVGTNKTLILLLDEPGLNLHAMAQNDFLFLH